MAVNLLSLSSNLRSEFYNMAKLMEKCFLLLFSTYQQLIEKLRVLGFRTHLIKMFVHVITDVFFLGHQRTLALGAMCMAIVEIV